MISRPTFKEKDGKPFYPAVGEETITTDLYSEGVVQAYKAVFGGRGGVPQEVRSDIWLYPTFAASEKREAIFWHVLPLSPRGR